MWRAAGDAARAAGRFARRHRRAVVVGGVIGAATCLYYSTKKAIKEAEQEQEAIALEAGERARYKQCLARTRGECVAALVNFLPALRKRLFLEVDVTGPVRELKALRGGGVGAKVGVGVGVEGRSGGVPSSSSSGGDRVAADGSAMAPATDLEAREIHLWEQVKVTVLTRLVVSLYAFNALALMLHMQLHILGRLSFEESQAFLRKADNRHPDDDDDGAEINARLSSGNLTMSPFREERASPAAAARPTDLPGSPTTTAATTTTTTTTQNTSTNTTSEGKGEFVGDVGGIRSGGGGARPEGLAEEGEGRERRGVALSMEARHALLSATYEHVLGQGLRGLVRDVKRAVSRCTTSWSSHTRQEVGFLDLVAVLRKVRREIEGPIGGAPMLYGGGGGSRGADGEINRRGDIFGRSSGVRHSALLRYIINPSDGINGEATPPTIASSSTTSSSSSRDGAGSYSAEEDMFGRGGIEGVRDVLDETWDTAESPNFASALQSCLDATFGMVCEQLRQKAFCRGGAGGQYKKTPTTKSGAVEEMGGSEGPGGGCAAPPSSPPSARAVTATTAATASAGREGAAAVVSPIGETDELTQVLATVISQAKLVVSEILEPSPSSEYALAVASLPAVQDLCFSIFGSNRAPAAASISQ